VDSKLFGVPASNCCGARHLQIDQRDMNVMRWFLSRLTAVPESWALLLLRLVMGAAFVLHGWPKVHHPFSWMNMTGSSPAPGFLQATAAFVELIGGFLLILGLLTRLAALGITAQMIGAFALVHLPHHDPFVAPGRPSYEPALVYLVLAILLLVTGPGRWSLDAVLFGAADRRATAPGIAPPG
jgi:putative oxidoreductase